MPIVTPCTKVCTIDATSGLCLGCCRTLDEIAQWTTLSDAERARIMTELPSRSSRPEGRVRLASEPA
jgi:uncharacterized protein